MASIYQIRLLCKLHAISIANGIGVKVNKKFKDVSQLCFIKKNNVTVVVLGKKLKTKTFKVFQDSLIGEK